VSSSSGPCSRSSDGTWIWNDRSHSNNVFLFFYFSFFLQGIVMSYESLHEAIKTTYDTLLTRSQSPCAAREEKPGRPEINFQTESFRVWPFRPRRREPLGIIIRQVTVA
jgi:hypothetical protein